MIGAIIILALLILLVTKMVIDVQRAKSKRLTQAAEVSPDAQPISTSFQNYEAE